MPPRKTILATGEIYHLLNRGVASAPIYSSSRDYQRFLELVDFYRFDDPGLSFSKYLQIETQDRKKFLQRIKQNHPPLVEIFCYCLIPNHFHFLVRQLVDGGIQKMFTRVQNAYAKYFNAKNKRHGPLFQSRFQAIRVESEDIFLHVSRYIHLNPSTAFLVGIKKLLSYKWSSYPEYLKERKPVFVNLDLVSQLIGSAKKYEKFVLNNADYQRRLALIKHLTLE